MPRHDLEEKIPHDDNIITLSVYFSGTGFNIRYDHQLAATKLYADDNGIDLTSEFGENPTSDSSQQKMGFNGCGMDYGMRGIIFGHGLELQCQQVINHVDRLLKEGKKIRLNAYGHSRGGNAALMLAKALSRVPANRLEINLALMDPVPGNLPFTSTIDAFGISLANQTADLSECHNLKKVLCLYPYQPLPESGGLVSIIEAKAHAPLFPDYPDQCDAREEVLPGCHSVTERMKLTYYRARLFFEECGTTFPAHANDASTQALLLAEYEKINLKNEQPSTRYGHGNRDVHIASQPSDQVRFLNKHHQALAGGDLNEEQCLLKMKETPALQSLFMHSLKWLLIGLSLAALLYLTGGLAAIPMLSGIVTTLGPLSIPAFAPIAALACRWILRPLCSLIHPLFTLSKYRYQDTPAQDGQKHPADIGAGSWGDFAERNLFNPLLRPEEQRVTKADQQLEHKYDGYTPASVIEDEVDSATSFIPTNNF